ncbi:tRNA (adenosine(37)-N6)-threonylcarbamoyltransferase complex dimerization subunit type 1 TsaB [Agrococcus sp. SGAir0287]|uniref:tRNA (adenosine(37)-N6)-threonylcarbamoyltransferase complex dimerization subunit type 1 TsaB n=1 Tax=Agrococcus sp. SGAir0287 TaxID=2070347 RepID=UPI0010CCECF9|nr:tRNA (adenosine(37)-N6)-threonylcarbamoyltransferase complex dimerization subunit type 1 TsaB [Agrococcus sp. SGAir0287]QCR20035.1 tRNA (adenosine(37)-N6)-threonylcarbamoyltransferase complex dimerization subunit type 1 TsaB [Agrococcus sp. SGAir0287]
MILAIDTSLGTSIALVDAGRVVAAHDEHDTRRHAEVLDVALAVVLGDHRDAVTQVVAGLGPGAFTGLRIGIVAARTAALGLGVPWVGVCSHDAVGVAEPGLVQVTTDVRRRERAWSLYRGGARVQGPALAPAAAVPVIDGARRVDADWIGAAGLVAALAAGAGSSREAIYLREADAVPSAAPKRVTS